MGWTNGAAGGASSRPCAGGTAGPRPAAASPDAMPPEPQFAAATTCPSASETAPKVDALAEDCDEAVRPESDPRPWGCRPSSTGSSSKAVGGAAPNNYPQISPNINPKAALKQS